MWSSSRLTMELARDNWNAASHTLVLVMHNLGVEQPFPRRHYLSHFSSRPAFSRLIIIQG